MLVALATYTDSYQDMLVYIVDTPGLRQQHERSTPALTTMTVLEWLPYEVLTEILSHLPCADLATACRLSQHMRTVSKPLLYRALSFATRYLATPSTAELLLQTLLSPGGDRLTHQACSLCVQWDGISSQARHPHPDLTKNTTVEDAGMKHGLNISCASQGARVALLVLLLPRLRVLDMTAAHPDFFNNFMEARSSPAFAQDILLNLRKFRYSSDDRNVGLTPAALLTVLNLPCIRDVEVHILRFREFPFTTFNVAATSTVTHLRFTKANLHPLFLEWVFKIPIALTHFSYSGERGTIDFNPPAFGRALALLRRRLEFLHLDLTEVALGDDGQTGSFPQTIGSLRDWPALRTVSCPLMALLGHGVELHHPPSFAYMLPVKIAELEILKDKYWPLASDQVLELLNDKSAVPALRTLVTAVDNRLDLGSQCVLRVPCKAAGVDLVDNSWAKDSILWGQCRDVTGRLIPSESR